MLYKYLNPYRVDVTENLLKAIDRHKLNVKVYSAHLLFDKYALGFSEISPARVYSHRMREFYKEAGAGLKYLSHAGHTERKWAVWFANSEIGQTLE